MSECDVPLRADEAASIARNRSNGHIGCYYAQPMYEAIRKAAERGAKEMIYVTEERDQHTTNAYIWNLFDKGYSAQIVGRDFEGNYVLRIEW